MFFITTDRSDLDTSKTPAQLERSTTVTSPSADTLVVKYDYSQCRYVRDPTCSSPRADTSVILLHLMSLTSSAPPRTLTSTIS